LADSWTGCNNDTAGGGGKVSNQVAHFPDAHRVKSRVVQCGSDPWRFAYVFRDPMVPRRGFYLWAGKFYSALHKTLDLQAGDTSYKR